MQTAHYTSRRLWVCSRRPYGLDSNEAGSHCGDPHRQQGQEDQPVEAGECAGYGRSWIFRHPSAGNWKESCSSEASFEECLRTPATHRRLQT
jgi:hypothetical protein